MALTRAGGPIQRHCNHPRRRSLLQTKWGVSALVFAVLVWRHDKHAAWCVLGSILSSFVCKVLKHVINERRPPAARKKDPGMPSSHANSEAPACSSCAWRWHVPIIARHAS